MPETYTENGACGFCGNQEDVTTTISMYGEPLRRCRDAVPCAKRHLAQRGLRRA